jgi:hypothetical protein
MYASTVHRDLYRSTILFAAICDLTTHVPTHTFQPANDLAKQGDKQGDVGSCHFSASSHATKKATVKEGLSTPVILFKLRT